MTVTVESFQQSFPEFADPGTYDSNMINLYITLGVNLQNGMRWDPNTFDYGTMLYVAHNCVLDARNRATARAGGLPGELQGPKTASSVDAVSKSMDTVAVRIEDGDQWNLTSYGVRFLHLVKLYGAGPIQVNGAGCGAPSPLFLGSWF